MADDSPLDLSSVDTSVASTADKVKKPADKDSADLSLGNIIRLQQKSAKQDQGMIESQQSSEKDWNAKNPAPNFHVEPFKEKPPENDPIKGFGSWASAIGILASLKTKTPLTSALNASAHAISATRQNDLDAFEHARQAFKDNMEAAKLNAEWEQKAYDNALKGHEKDQVLALARMKAIAAQTQDGAMMQLIDTGHLRDIIELLDSRKKMNIQFEDHMSKMNDEADKQHERMLAADAVKQFSADNKRPPTPQEEAVIRGKITAGLSGKAGDETQVAQTDSIKAFPKDLQNQIKSQTGESRGKATLAAQSFFEREGKYPNATELQSEIAEQKKPLPSDIAGAVDKYSGVDRSKYTSDDAILRRTISAADLASDETQRTADYVLAHPQSVGAIATVSRKMNLDSFKSIFQETDPDKKSEAASESMADFDRTADETLSEDQASEAKLMNKQLTTLALKDAQASSSGRMNQLLEKTYMGLYDQSARPETLLKLLNLRMTDQNGALEENGLSLNKRKEDKRLPFWDNFNDYQIALGHGYKSFTSEAEAEKAIKSGAVDPNSPILLNGKLVRVSQ